MLPNYDLNKIKFATDGPTFQRAVGLYEGGKITKVEEFGRGYAAIVLGTESYHVSVSARNYKHGNCTCYFGQKDTLCKHMVALALYVVRGGQLLSAEDKKQSHHVECGSRREALSGEEIKSVKKSISLGMRYIKPYTGPSRTWFSNQDSLMEGCSILSAIVSDLPVNRPSAEILIKLLLRLDKKLCEGGVDDSNGIVGGFMREVVQVLMEYARIDPECIKAFKLLTGIGNTCFGWEEPLVCESR
jgi:hypothetical protein